MENQNEQDTSPKINIGYDESTQKNISANLFRFGHSLILGLSDQDKLPFITSLLKDSNSKVNFIHSNSSNEDVVNQLRELLKEMNERLKILKEAKKDNHHQYNEFAVKKMIHNVLLFNDFSNLKDVEEINSLLLEILKIGRATGCNIIINSPCISHISTNLRQNLPNIFYFDGQKTEDSKILNVELSQYNLTNHNYLYSGTSSDLKWKLLNWVV